MNFDRTIRRTHSEFEYRYALNRVVSDNSIKEELSEEEKLAQILLYNLDHYSLYGNQDGLAYTYHVLYHYAKIEKDKNDMFGRWIINLSAIPDVVRKKLFRDYKTFLQLVEAYIKGDKKKLDKLNKSGKVVINGNSQDVASAENMGVVGELEEVEIHEDINEIDV